MNQKILKYRHFSVLSKMLLTAVLMTVLFWCKVITLESLSIVVEHPTASLTAFIIILMAFFVGVLRWKILLSAVGIHIGFWKLAQISGASIFIGNILPGSVGGDAVRVLYVLRKTQSDNKLLGVSTIIADRVIGLFGFMSLGLLLILFQNNFNGSENESNAWYWHIGLFMMAVLVGCCVVFAYAKIMQKKLEAYSEGQLKGIKKLFFRLNQSLVQVLEAYQHRKKTLVLAWILSLAISLLVTSMIPVLAEPYGYTEIKIVNYLIASVMANLSNVIPLTPGGIGIGEAVFNHVCHLLEMSPTTHAYGNVFFQARMVVTLLNLTGALGFILYNQQKKQESLVPC